MSTSTNTNPKALLQELKTNRRTQVALGACALAMVYLLWPTSTKPRSKTIRLSSSTGGSLTDQQLAALRSLPDLDKLGQAGKVPQETRVFRDLFLFDALLPPPPPPKPVPPPPPPTPEEIAAKQLQEAKDAEMNTRPQDLRYLGFMESKSGRLGAFMKGEEPITLKMGAQPKPGWRLVEITDKFAEFQSIKYPELRHKLSVRESNAASGPAMPSNEF